MTRTISEILVEGLRVRAHVGVTPEERTAWQSILADIICELDLARPIKDTITETVNYVTVCDIVKRIFLTKEFSLLEAAAEHIAAELFALDARVRSFQIVLRKPHKLPECDALGVRLTFSRETGMHTSHRAEG